MTKTVILIMSLILLTSVGIFSIVQRKKLNNTKDHLSTQLRNIQKLEDSLASESNEKTFLSELNTELQEENEILRDSIDQLHKVIGKLRKRLQQQDATIAELRQKVFLLEKEYDARKKEIAILSRRDEVDTELIAQKEAQKTQIKNEMTNHQQEYSNAVAEKIAIESELSDKENSQDRFRKIVDIVNNTRVEFQNISILKEVAGRPITRIIADGKNWRMTNIEFFMNHNDVKTLLDQQFLVKIVDIDNQEELDYAGSTELFPENAKNIKGAPFFYDGNMIEVNYKNTNAKKGKNYEVQIYFRSTDGEEYLLLDGVRQFIREGDIVAL